MPDIPAIAPDLGVIDELQAWYLAKADAEGLVFSRVVQLLIERMYQQRNYLARRKAQGHHTTYDYQVEQDMKALAWAIRALVCYTPDDEKAKPQPPKPPRKPSQRGQKPGKNGGPSWNTQPKREWAGPDLPPVARARRPPATRSQT
jgi:hypothetical protein